MFADRGSIGRSRPQGCRRFSSRMRCAGAWLPANLKISPAAVIDPDAAPVKTPTAALPA